MVSLTKLAALYGTGQMSAPTTARPASSVQGSAGSGAAPAAYVTENAAQDKTSSAMGQLDSRLGNYLLSLASSNSDDRNAINGIINNLTSELAALPDTAAGKQQAVTDIDNAMRQVEQILHSGKAKSAEISQHVVVLTENYLGLGLPASSAAPPSNTPATGPPFPATAAPTGYSGSPPSGEESGLVAESTSAFQGSAQQILRQAAAQFGWGSGPQWDALVSVENREAGFRATAQNPSGALGLAQALGHGGADTAGSLGDEYGGYGLTAAQARAANSGNAADQALWMCNYIKQTYGTPAAAEAHEQSYGWY